VDRVVVEPLVMETAPARANRNPMDRVAAFFAALAGIALLLIFAREMVEIILRNLFGRSTMFADEMCGYLNVGVVFLGLAYTLARGGFIRVEMVYRHLKGAAKRAADWYAVIVSLAFASTLLYQMVKYTIYSFVNDVRSPEVTATPQYIPQLLVVIGVSVLVVQLLVFAARRCRGLP
jgi:TRAP-type C4-dicarboxylate transport system permease small subunit